MISVKGLDKAEVLAALYNGSRQQGMGFLNLCGAEGMSIEEAAAVIASCGDRLYFDYLRGRVMKVDLTTDEFDEWLYDRDNGQGAAARAIAALRAGA